MLDEKQIKGTFVNDRGYDNNEIFKYYFRRHQDFIIRLKENRKVYKDHKWYKITVIRDSRKGKVKMKLLFQGEEKECYVSVLFVNKIIKESKSLREKVYLWFYQLARGIYNILKMAKTGIRQWENIRKTKQYNGQLSLI